MPNLVPSLSPDVFNQGAVRVNSDALTNYVINTQARNQARDQAFTKYLAEQGSNINDKGVRADKDLADIMAAKNDWQQHALQNRRALQNPGMDQGVAYSENQKKYNKVLNLIRQSQEAAKNNQEAEAILKDPKKRALLTDASMQAYHKSQLPIGNGFEPMDFTDIYNPKPWGISDQLKLSSTVSKLGTETPGTPEPIGGGKQKIKYSRSFSPVELSNVAAEAHDLYGHNAGFKQMVEGIDPHSQDFKSYNDLFKQHYGKDIETPEDAATAYVLGTHNKMSREDVSTIPLQHLTPDQKFDEFKKRVDYRNAHRPAKAASTKVPDTATPIEDDFNDLIDRANKNPKEVTISRKDGSKEHYDILPVTPKQLEAFNTRGSDNKTHQAVSLGISKDRKTVVPIYGDAQPSATGNYPIAPTTKPISAEQAKKAIGKVTYGTGQVLKETKLKKAKENAAPVSADEAQKLIDKYK